MKKIIAVIVTFIFTVVVTPAFAKGNGGNGPHPSQAAYEHANENARFKRDKDWQPGDHDRKDKEEKEEHHKKKEHKHHPKDKDHKKDHGKKSDNDDDDKDDSTTPVTHNGTGQ